MKLEVIVHVLSWGIEVLKERRGSYASLTSPHGHYSLTLSYAASEPLLEGCQGRQRGCSLVLVLDPGLVEEGIAKLGSKKRQGNPLRPPASHVAHA